MTTILHYLSAVWLWAKANPAIAWPIVTAIVTITLKPRTPAQYTAMASQRPVWFWSRFTPLLQLVGALGLDPVKALQVVGKVFSGRQDGGPPGPTASQTVVSITHVAEGDEETKPGLPRTMLHRTFAAMFFAVFLVGCSPSPTTKAHEAEGSYAAAHAKCATTEPSREAIDACRAKVRVEWHVTAPDGDAR